MDLEDDLLLDQKMLMLGLEDKKKKIEENIKMLNNLKIRDNLIIELFNILGIKLDKVNDILGKEIASEKLYSVDTLKKYIKMVPKLKKYYNSSKFNFLHKNAIDKQKFFSVNVLRQVVKSLGYYLRTENKSDGYTKSGKKIYKRTYYVSET